MRYYGEIGFSINAIETKPGIWDEHIEKRKYYMNVTKDFVSYNDVNEINPDININNQVSIIADADTIRFAHTIKYVELFGVKWKVKSFDIKRPRLNLYVGGLYNE
jgi:hypothetical protein